MIKSHQITILIILCISLFACATDREMTQTAKTSEQIAHPIPMPCPLILLPVCGTDGKTYDNACNAKAAGVEVAKEEACQNEIDPIGQKACTREYRPVCGESGGAFKWYPNLCELNRAQAVNILDEDCPAVKP